MLRIGDFSKICRVPVSALRYYADTGLLTPVHVDPITGYRYYTFDQLPQLNRILALKDLGLSLASIRRLLDESISPAEIQGMLRLREAELAQQVADAQSQLQRVRVRLRQIQQEAQEMAPEVVVRTIDAQPVLSVREVIPDGDQVAALLVELVIAMGTEQRIPAAPPMTIFHDPEFKDTDLDVEVACPVARPVKSGFATSSGYAVAGRMLEALPAAACTYHVGSFETLVDTYAALGRWLETSGYQISGPPREIYLRPPGESEPALTEIQMPVERA
ncbi:MAG: MerR family transcriptional regulator [Chloroflexi bacterium]|nr:MerR family transcriptional regulator [Chloroflexota bacterium]